jgi:hypothetical protein
MNLANGVKAVSLDVRGIEWGFKFTGSGVLNCLNNAVMEKVGCGYVVSIPYFGSTKNQMFKDRDTAFSFINDFIRRNA